MSAAGNRAVLCDDDAMVRSVVRRIMEDAGYLVAGESADPIGAADAVARTDADLLVLDLALRGGPGEDVLGALRANGSATKVVVFSAYVGDHADLLARGATAVVEKPDFTRLEELIGELRGERPSAATERRRPSGRSVPTLPPPTSISVSGFEPWDSFGRAVDELSEGDALLVLDVVPDARLREVWDHVHRLDHRIAVGRAALSVRRADGRVTLTPEGLPVLALVAGHPEAPAAFFDRLERAWQREVASGVPVGAFTHVRAERRPATLLDDVIGTLLGGEIDAEHPLRIV